MTAARECFVLPGLFLTVAWLGGFRLAEHVRLAPPPLVALALAMLLMGCLVRASVLVPELLMNSGRTALENLSGLVVLLTLFAASAQVFNLVTPESGFLHVLFSVFFLVQLLTTLAAVRDRQLLLRGLAVLFGSAFLIRFVALESLYSTEGGTLQRVLTAVMEGATLGSLQYQPHQPATGYVAFLALALFMAGLILLAPRRSDALLPGPSGSSPRFPAPAREIDGTALLVVTVLSWGCTGSAMPAGGDGGAAAPGAALRDAALASARVWQQPSQPIRQVDLGANPPGGWRPGDEVSCRFVPKEASGTTPKFDCELPGGEVVKVKYGRANEELYAEVAATRLLAALGFGSDQMFVVEKVTCAGCPPLPYHAMRCYGATGAKWPCFARGLSSSREFRHAVIERRIPGRRIETVEDQGWAWFELDRIDPARGGSSRAEVDALRLLAIVLAHWDNKAANQRLVCPDGADRPDGSCAAPIAIVQDLGAVFGPRKVDLRRWRRFPVWADARSCRVSMKTLPWSGGTFPDHQIGEEGRLLLLGLLDQLSRAQIEVLFTASRITAFDAPDPASRRASAWADAFLDKVRQIRDAGPCRSPVAGP